MSEDLRGDGGCLREITATADVANPAVCKQGDYIFAKYKGMLQDGTVFDQSHGKSHREPYGFDFQVGAGQVITGWDVGFQGMKIGQKAKLTLRSDYAYGDAGAPPQIPAGATLIFEVELIAIGNVDGAGKQVTGNGPRQ